MNYALLIRFATARQAVNQREDYKVKVIRIKHNYSKVMLKKCYITAACTSAYTEHK